jgi:hypothetical protein
MVLALHFFMQDKTKNFIQVFMSATLLCAGTAFAENTTWQEPDLAALQTKIKKLDKAPDRPMLFNFAALIFLISSSVFASDVTYNPSQYKTSFHSLILANAPVMTETIKAECFNSLQQHIRSKDSFYSQAIEKNYTIQVKDLGSLERDAFLNGYGKTYEPKDGLFFHYTKSTELIKIAQEQSFADIFSYLRKPGTKESSDMFWYIAGDPISSDMYGPIQIRVHINPDAKIFTPVKQHTQGNEAFDRCNGRCTPEQYPSFFDEKSQTTNEIENELISKYSDLATCKNLSIKANPRPRFVNDASTFTILEMLAADDNQISLIAYYGAKSDMGWFQVLGEWAIERTEYKKK